MNKKDLIKKLESLPVPNTAEILLIDNNDNFLKIISVESENSELVCIKGIKESSEKGGMWHGFIHAWDGAIVVRPIDEYIRCESTLVKSYIPPFYVPDNSEAMAFSIAKSIVGGRK